MNVVFAFEQAVLGTIRAHAAIGLDDRVLVAVSGGADSTALLAALDALCRRGALPADLAVAHLDHGLRDDSARDAIFVTELAQRFDRPCFVERASCLASSRGNVEATARSARYAFLARVAGEWGATRTALAHTRDDQAETVLLRLARGAGPQSLAAMRVTREDGVVRPLLAQPRRACVAYLEARGLTWVEDPSNADERFFRNRVRRRLLPLLEAELEVDVRARLARLAVQLREESALAEQRIAELLPGDPAAGLPLAALRAAGAGAPRLMHAWLARAGIRAGERQVETVMRVADGARPSGTVDLGRGARVVRRYEVLTVLRGAASGAACSTAALAIPGEAHIAGWSLRAEPASGPVAIAADDVSALDLDRLSGPLRLRAPVPGDRVRLVHGRRKLADILIDARVPRHERSGLAVVSCGDDVLWVPGVVRSVVARPSPESRRCVVLRAERVTTVVASIESNDA
jgi:tRNA(Ile)-lysidine synthase